MGMVIGLGQARYWTIDTPEGDSLAYGQRIQDYVNKIQSDGWTASALAARRPGQAIDPTKLDDHAGSRAEVPAEMFPPVLIVDTDESVLDFNGGSPGGYFVSQRFRDAVEVLDPGIHQFVPFELRRHDGQLYEGRPYYILRIMRLINAINLAQSPQLRQVGSLVTPTETTMFHIEDDAPFVVHADRIEGMGLWRDTRNPQFIFASDRLVTLLRERAPTGWASQATFIEI
jgi:Protein of unknown function (DUF1629)